MAALLPAVVASQLSIQFLPGEANAALYCWNRTKKRVLMRMHRRASSPRKKRRRRRPRRPRRPILKTRAMSLVADVTANAFAVVGLDAKDE
jgi:hypothetical protein